MTPHNCEKKQEKRREFIEGLKKAERLKEQKLEEYKEKIREPVYYYCKDISQLKDLTYIEDPKVQESMITQLCNCGTDIFPIHKKTRQFHFDDMDILGIDDRYWCGKCGNPLSSNSVQYWFSIDG